MSSVIKKGRSLSKSTLKPMQLNEAFKVHTNGRQNTKSAHEVKLEAELEKFRAQNLELKSLLEEQAKQGELLIEKAKVDVEKSVLAKVKESQEESITLLSKGLEVAKNDFDDKLTTLESLALLLAQTALEKLLDSSDDYSEFVTRSVAHQMSFLRREMVMGVNVSLDDFKCEEALQGLRESLDLQKIEINTTSQLKAGDCIIDLRLGHIEMSIKEQWTELQNLFSEMAMECS